MARLIVFIVIFAVFLAFIVLNLDNKCDISFGFKTFNEVPVFLSALCSFVLGMLVTVPLLLTRGKKREKQEKPERPKPFKKAKVTDVPDEMKKENSPYGID